MEKVAQLEGEVALDNLEKKGWKQIERCRTR